jgi:uncharacterized protein YuzE
VRVEYDEDADVAYIALSAGLGMVWKTVEATDYINLDLGRTGELIGIEVLSARKQLPRSFLGRFANRVAKPS